MNIVGNSEILFIAEAVAREKNLHKDEVLEALEEAIKVAAKRKYGHEHPIQAHIDRRTGEIKLSRHLKVSTDEEIEAAKQELQEAIENKTDRALKRDVGLISLEEAKYKKFDAQLGDVIIEILPPIDLGRVAAQTAKQVIIHKVKESEKARNFEEFKDRVGKIVSGIITEVEHAGVKVKIGSAEAIINNDHLIRDEKKRMKPGDRIRAIVCEVSKETKGAQIILSRTHNNFLAELFAQEVPEIYDRIIQIKAIARDPGQRAKIAVFTSDSSIDPVGSCVGMKGSRVQAVINELCGERIDIIPWSQDPAGLIVNALSPAEVTKVIIDEQRKRIEVVVPDEQLSIAIGKRGQNVRLASQLVGWAVDVMTEEVESKRRNEEFSAITKKFMHALDLEEILAQLLASEGFTSIADIAESSISDIASIEGLDEGVAEELISRAKEYSVTHEDAANVPAAVSTAVASIDPKIKALSGINDDLIVSMYDAGIRTVTDLADLASDEFVEKIPDSGLTNKQIDAIIMAAREVAFFK